MDLKKVETVVAGFKTLDIAEQADVLRRAENVKTTLAKDLAAVEDSDRAAVAWFCAQMLICVRDLPVKDVGEVLEASCVAYAVVTAQLLGWM